MIRLKDILFEGVYDKTSLKAVIMSGGPGSGKTYMTKKLFGFDDTLQKANLSSYGMKRIDPDYFYVDLLTKAGYDLNLEKMRSDPKLKGIDDLIRAAAIEKSGKQKTVMIDSRLGVILDTTSASIKRVSDNKEQLEEKGYDVICVFIDTPLEVALERNRTRDRKLPEKLVEEMWHECQENKKELQNIFGNNFYVIKDDNVGEIQKRLNKFLSEPIKNPIGKAWIELQLKLKDRSHLQMKEYFDAEDVISTMADKNKKIEYFRIEAISPSGKEVRTGWMPAQEKTIKDVTKQLEQEMYKIVKVERKSNL